MPNIRQSTSTQYAGFWRRLAASLVDGWIVSLLGMGISLSLGTDPWNVDNTTTMGSVDVLLTLIMTVGYFLLFWVNFDGATPGKKMFGIKISSLKAGKVGYPQAIVRYITQFISAIPFALGYLWVAWDGKKQAWHDKFAQTVVVKTNSKHYGFGIFAVIFISFIIYGSIFSFAFYKGYSESSGWGSLETDLEAQEIASEKQEQIDSMTPEVRALYEESEDNFERMRTEKMEEDEYVALSNKNIDTLVKATELDPDNHVLWSNLSAAYTWMNTRGTLEDGLYAIEKAIELDPQNFTYVNSQADMLSRLGRDDEAVLVLEALGREINTDNYGYYHMKLGTAYLNLSIYDKAIEHLEQAESIFADSNSKGSYDQELLSIRKMIAQAKAENS